MISSDEWSNCMSSIPYSRYLIYPVPWYSFLIVTGIVLAVFLAYREERRTGLQKDTVLDLALYLIPSGIIGARIYYVIFSWNQFSSDLWSVFRIWEGGIAIYGGIIGGFVALLVFSRKRRISPLILCDLIAPGLALAQCIGRWGNWFNIEAYGLKITKKMLCFFPIAVQVPADGNAWHLAAFFYESVWALLICIFLLAFRHRKLSGKGDVFFFYLFLYAAGRLVIEETRIDSLYLSSSIRVSQLLSVLLCLFVLIRYILIARKNKSLSVLTRFVFIPLALVAACFSLVYSLSGFIAASWPAFRILLCLSLSSLFMMICLFSVRFSASFREVSHADN